MDLLRNHLRQGMTHVGRRNAVLFEQIDLKRKNAQHMVHALADFFHTFGAPSPNGWADKMHRANAVGFEVAL